MSFRSLVVFFALISAAISLAQPLNYAQRSVPIRVGVLLIESQRVGGGPALSSVPANVSPFVWYALDTDRSSKPASWTFVNPHASTILTQATRDRWLKIPGGGTIPPTGTKLNKNNAPYWEVSLANSSDASLASYDILVLSINGALALNPLERERLRRFVDQGGIVWCDIVTSGQLSIDVGNPLPLPFALTAQNVALDVDPINPILNSPNTVTTEDLNLMQSGGFELFDAPNMGSYDGVYSWLRPDFFRLNPVTFDSTGNRSTIMVGSIGDGFVLYTTRGISSTLNRATDANGNFSLNIGFTSGKPIRDAALNAAAKLIINAAHLTGGFASATKGSRHTNSSFVSVDAPLLSRFTAAGASQGGSFSPDKAPAIFKGLVVGVTNDQVIVMDANPGGDYDGDGNPDDGVPDAPDYSGDLIWTSQSLPGPLSTPTCVEVPDSKVSDSNLGGSTVTNQILVTDRTGKLHVFNMNWDPKGGSSLLNVKPVKTIDPPQTTQIPEGGPFAPTVHEDLAFIADGRADGNVSGRIWVVDLRTGSRLTGKDSWCISQTPRLPVPSASPTVGYVPILDNSGGVDKVVYVPTVNTEAGGGQQRPAGLSSIWAGVRGEKPASIEKVADTLKVTTRASLQGLPIVIAPGSPLGIKITLLKSTGDPYSTAQTKAYLSGVVADGGSNGELNIGLTGAGQALDFGPSGVGVRIDYTIDWGAVGFGANSAPADAFIRGQLLMPDDSNTTRKILGNIALAPNGNLFVVHGSPIQPTGYPKDRDKGGTLFGFREEGRGRFKMILRWDMFKKHVIKLNNGASSGDQINYPEAVIDNDEIGKAFNILAGPITRPVFQGGPTIKGDTVFVSASGEKTQGGFPIPVSVVLAFKANPPAPEFFVNSVGGNFILSQRDFARSNDKNTPEVYSDLRQGQFTYEVDGSGTGGRIRLDSLMNIEQGQIRDSISTNMPVIIRGKGQNNTDIILEPELTDASLDQTNNIYVPGNAAGRWSPLQWYTVFPGLSQCNQPLVTGQTLYLSGSSVLPSIFSGTGFVPKGLLSAIDSNISANDPFMVSVDKRPWQLQLKQFKDVGIGNPPFKVNNDIRWPQIYGITSFEDFRIRLLQAALADDRAYGVIAGDGVLVSWGAKTLYGFTRSDFVVCDEGRVGRFDASGNPIWTIDGSRQSGETVPVEGVSTGIPLSRPSRVYQTADNSFWVVDNGNDRVVRFDASGRELRTISGFKFDPKFRPVGSTDNIKKTLRLPRDVLVFNTYESNPTSMTSPRALELWIHYVIADAGNFRMLELIDRFDVDPVTRRVRGPVEYVDPQSNRPGQVERAVGILYWNSPIELSGKQYAYNSIARIFTDDGKGNRIPIFAFGFGNIEPGKASFGLDNTNQNQDAASGYGGIVLYNGNQSKVIDKVIVPSIPGGAFYQDASGKFDSTPRPASVHQISGLSSVTLRYVSTNNGGSTLAVMFADTSGVYEVIQNGNDWVTRWYLPNEAYRAMRRRFDGTLSNNNPLNARPVFARRLDSGEVIVVNGYVGVTRNSLPYTGEVVLIEGVFNADPKERGFDWNKLNLGFDSLSIKAEISQVQGTRGIYAPVFGDRR